MEYLIKDESAEADLAAIREWLQKEEAQGVHGNFLCNWSVIERAHHKRGLSICVEPDSGIIVAFQLGGLLTPGILQVKSDFRGRGIGRAMVEHCIDRARSHNESLLYIECNPSTSIPFWQAMGFTLIESEDYKNFAYRVLEKTLNVPSSGHSVVVEIRFFPRTRDWNETTKAFSAHYPNAVRDSETGIVWLDNRVLFHEEAFRDSHDVVVEIRIDGRISYLGKAKNHEADLSGVMRCRNGYYIDWLEDMSAEYRAEDID